MAGSRAVLRRTVYLVHSERWGKWFAAEAPAQINGGLNVSGGRPARPFDEQHGAVIAGIEERGPEPVASSAATPPDGLDSNASADRSAEQLSHFRPVRIRKAADVVVDILVDAIRNGLFVPGDKFPRERDLAAQLEVSRTTVREATSILHRAGVLSVRRGNRGGAIVVSRAIPPDLLRSVQRLDRSQELRALLEARRPLELVAGILAVRRGTVEVFEQISALVDQLEPLAEVPLEFMHLDFQVHLKIAEASQNPMIVRYLDDLLKKQSSIRAEYPVETFDTLFAVQLHRRALEALINRDERAMLSVVDEHLASVESHIFGERLHLPAFGTHEGVVESSPNATDLLIAQSSAPSSDR